MANLLTCEGGERSQLQTTWVWGPWWENCCFTRGNLLGIEGGVLGELDLVHFAPCAVQGQISRSSPCSSPPCTGQECHRVIPSMGATHEETAKCSCCWRPELKHTWPVTCPWLREAARIAGITRSSQSPRVRTCICKTKSKARERQFLRQERLRHE